jgi:hypothetical protein
MGAEGLGAEGIAGRLIGAGSASAADVEELAGATLASVGGEVAKLAEERGGFPDVAEGPLPDVAAGAVEVATGLHVPGIGDEAEGFACKTSSGGGGDMALSEDAVEMRGARGSDLDGGLGEAVGEPLENLLVAFRIELEGLEVGGTARGDEEEDVVGDGPEADGELENPRQLVDVFGGDGGIELEGEACLCCGVDAAQCPIECSGYTAECVVAGGLAAVDADADAADACVEEPSGAVGVEQGAVGRRDSTEATFGGMSCDGLEIGAQEGFSAGEDECGACEGGDVVDELEAFVGVELAGRGAVDGCGAAVSARQVAGTGEFPGDHAKGIWALGGHGGASAGGAVVP